MMLKILQNILTAFLLLTVNLAQAQVRFSATISPSQINKDEYAQLQFTVENANDVQQITAPALKDFIVVSGPNQMNGMSSINGSVTRYTAITYMIKPKAAGNFTIAPGTAKADGKEFKSNTVYLQVTNNLSGNNKGGNSFTSPFNGIDLFEEPRPSVSLDESVIRKGENIQDKVNRNMLVKADVSKTSCYVGEPIIVTYKLYTRLKSESNLSNNPSFNGFSVIDLEPPGSLNYTREKLNGKEYNVYTIRRAQLYPLQPGIIQLESAEVENNIHFIKEQYAKQLMSSFNDLFDGFGEPAVPPEVIEKHTVTLKSKPLAITVKPLPENNKPQSFRGAVGRFELKAGIEKPEFTTDDAGKLLIVVEGEGNMPLINSPDIVWPQGIESFEPKATDDLNKRTVPVSGRKLFEYSFTAGKPGSYTIPAVAFSYFDATTGQYKTITSKELNFTVKQGTGKPTHLIELKKEGNKERFFNKLFSHREWIVGTVALFIISGLFFWIRKENKKDKAEKAAARFAEERKKEEAIVAVKQEHPLELTKNILESGNTENFYQALNIDLKKFISRRFDILPEELNKKTIAEKLDKKGIGYETALQTQQLMDEIDWQLYTPFNETEKMQALYEKASVLVEILSSKT